MQSTKNGLPHIEDLPIDDFIQCVPILNQFEITEKLDGSNLIIGLDDRGNFYTSREKKNGIKYYNANEYEKSFWSSGMRAAHTLIESKLYILKKYLPKNSTIECEILYGEQPNAIPYSKYYNYLVFLNSSANIDLAKLTNDLRCDTYLKITNIPKTKDGKHIQYVTEMQAWRITHVPKIILKNIDLEIATNINNNLQRFITKQNSKFPMFTNKQISEIKLNTTPIQITKKFWSENKHQLSLERNQIRAQIQELKLLIKEHLLTMLVKPTVSSLTSKDTIDGWIEGIVCKKDSIAFKIVDKNTFTAINSFNHLIRNELRHNFWMPLKLKLKQDSNNSSTLLSNYEIALTKLLELYKEQRYKLQKSIKLNNENKIFYYNNTIHERTLQEFAIMFDRINKIKTAISNNSSIENILSPIKHKNIKEGGNVFKTSQRINLEDIPDTLEYISTISEIPLSIIKENILGSVGKSKTSGDIDIAVCASTYDQNTLLNTLKKNLGGGNVEINSALHIIHTIVPIIHNKKKTAEYVQVDFMMTANIEWAKFIFFSAGDASNYKGVYRTELIGAIIAATNETKYENNELIYRKGWVKVPSKGFEFQIRERTLNKTGRRNKTFKVTHRGSVISDPQVIANMLFNMPISINQLDKIETIIPLINRYKTAEEKKLIMFIFKQQMLQRKLRYPQELE